MADSADFKAAAEKVRNLAKTPSNDVFASIYSLFKQATAGDCDKARPGITDPLGQAKHDAWVGRKGMSKEEAAAAYIKAASDAVATYGQK